MRGRNDEIDSLAPSASNQIKRSKMAFAAKFLALGKLAMSDLKAKDVPFSSITSHGGGAVVVLVRRMG